MHRNSQKRFYKKGYVYFVTVKTHNNVLYFKEEIFCELFIEELRLCKKLKAFELYAFGLHYNHFHLVLKPGDEANISGIMQSLKKNSSRNINRVMEGVNSDLVLSQQRNSSKAPSRDGAFDGANYLALIGDFHTQFIRKYGRDQDTIPRFKWQKSFYDHIMRDKNDFQKHCHYTAYNYLKHGLPTNWNYTSLRYPEIIDT